MVNAIVVEIITSGDVMMVEVGGSVAVALYSTQQKQIITIPTTQ